VAFATSEELARTIGFISAIRHRVDLYLEICLAIIDLHIRGCGISLGEMKI